MGKKNYNGMFDKHLIMFKYLIISAEFRNFVIVSFLVFIASALFKNCIFGALTPGVAEFAAHSFLGSIKALVV